MSQPKSKQYKSLLSLLAHASTGDARRLLIAQTGEDAKNKQDLVQRLAQMYSHSTNKLDLERQMAEIHPHKDFLIKYLAVKKNVEPISVQTTANATPVDVATEKTVVVSTPFSNADGGCQCNCCKNNNSENKSNASGEITLPQSRDNTALIVGMVSIVAIVGLVVYLKQR